MDQEQHEIICEVKTEDTGNLGTFAEQLSRLKEEPLKSKGKGEKEEKKDKKAEKEAIGRVSNMIAGGLVQGLKSGDVKGALEGVGLQMAEGMATSLVSKGIKSMLSAIPGFGFL